MTKSHIYLLLICLTFSCQQKQKKQEINVKNHVTITLPKKADQNSLIGFACYYSGKKTKPVERMSEILKRKEYTIIKEKLFDVNIGDKYLATICCERLEQKRLIKLSEIELNQIKKNKISKEIITICGGCTNEDQLTMEELFTKSKKSLSESTEEWLNEMMK